MFCATARFGYFANCGSDPILTGLKLEESERIQKLTVQLFNVLCTTNSMARSRRASDQPAHGNDLRCFYNVQMDSRSDSGQHFTTIILIKHIRAVARSYEVNSTAPTHLIRGTRCRFSTKVAMSSNSSGEYQCPSPVYDLHVTFQPSLAMIVEALAPKSTGTFSSRSP